MVGRSEEKGSRGGGVAVETDAIAVTRATEGERGRKSEGGLSRARRKTAERFLAAEELRFLLLSPCSYPPAVSNSAPNANTSLCQSPPSRSF
jgi:hypothetical protein